MKFRENVDFTKKFLIGTYLILEVLAQFFPRQHSVAVGINLLEHVDGSRTIFGWKKFDIKVKSSTSGNDVSSTL